MAHPDRKPPPEQPAGELFPIRTVASLTGVNAITLRAWERRYGLVAPLRTSTGHRLYRREDIEVIHQALGLMEKGVAISQVRRSLQADKPTSNLTLSNWQQFQNRMLAAITRFDEDALESAYNAALAVYPVEQVTSDLLVPLLEELGRRWENTTGSVAEEHFFGVYLRNKLGARFHHRPRTANGPRLLAACLPNEQHEIGLLLFALTAHERNLQPVLLGANTPLNELPTAARHARCAAIVLSGSVARIDKALGDDLRIVAATADVPVFVGGMTSVRDRDAIVTAGAIPLGVQLSLGAERIRAALVSAVSEK